MSLYAAACVECGRDVAVARMRPVHALCVGCGGPFPRLTPPDDGDLTQITLIAVAGSGSSSRYRVGHVEVVHWHDGHGMRCVDCPRQHARRCKHVTALRDHLGVVES